jgi:CubicO group peptidase (beta-lactamase class C family)
MSARRLLFLAAVFAASAFAQLSVSEAPDAITVISPDIPGWSATIDLKRGGAITALHIPRNGPNLVQTDSSFFNLFAMTSEKIDGRTIKAWSASNGRIERPTIVRRDGLVTVFVAGKAMSKRDETFFDYRHTYTFRADRVSLDGEAIWRFPKTSMTDSSMGFDAAPDTLYQPVRIGAGGKPPAPLELTTSGGAYFDEGIGYPMDAEFRLRNGHSFVLRAIDVPQTYRSNPRFIYEKPWQANWAGRWYWEGDADGKTRAGAKPAQYVAGEPFRYQYELVIDPTRTGNTPPEVTITSPVRDSRYYHVGDTVVLKGEAKDREDGPIPPDRLAWEIFGTAGRKRILQSGSGSSIAFTIPADTPRNQDYCQFAVRLSAADSKGAEGVDYLTIGVTPPFPASPSISKIEWDFGGRIALGKADVASLGVTAEGAPPQVRPKAWPVSPGVILSAASAAGSTVALVRKSEGLPPTVGISSSTDAGAHWNNSTRQFPEGAPFYPVVFTDGSADGYLYAWGSTWPKGTNPCHACRSIYLARVPATEAADRSKWEFFSYMKGDTPLWTPDPNRNYDSIADADGADIAAATYLPSLRRYLIVVATGTGYQMLDAPHPWGPYTAVGRMKAWDRIQPGSQLRLTIPTKWASADGHVVWAAYSDGRDTYLVRGSVALKQTSATSDTRWDEFLKTLPAGKTDSLLVMRGDQTIVDWYGEGFDAARPHGTASLAKAMVGSISLMLALADGRVRLDQPVADFIPQWRNDPKKRLITFRQLATHTSGLEDATDDAEGKPQPGNSDWKGDFWKRLDPPRDPFTLSRDFARVVREPGTKLPPGDDRGYSNAGFAMLSYAVTAAFRGVPGGDLRTLLRDRVLGPIGLKPGEWSVGYNQNFQVDGLSLVANWGGAAFTPHATAAVGRLMLNRGKRNGRQIIPEAIVSELTRDGIGWWVEAKPKSLPPDAFIGAGAGIELLVVIPSMDVVIVRYGKNQAKDWADLDAFLFAPVMDLLRRSR